MRIRRGTREDGTGCQCQLALVESMQAATAAADAPADGGDAAGVGRRGGDRGDRRRTQAATRTTQRDGIRDKTLTTGAGDATVKIPKTRTGSFFPALRPPPTRRRRPARGGHAGLREGVYRAVGQRRGHCDRQHRGVQERGVADLRRTRHGRRWARAWTTARPAGWADGGRPAACRRWDPTVRGLAWLDADGLGGAVGGRRTARCCRCAGFGWGPLSATLERAWKATGCTRYGSLTERRRADGPAGRGTGDAASHWAECSAQVSQQGPRREGWSGRSSFTLSGCWKLNPDDQRPAGAPGRPGVPGRRDQHPPPRGRPRARSASHVCPSLIGHGAPLVEVQRLLGHASLATTQIYLTTRPDQLRRSVAANPLTT